MAGGLEESHLGRLRGERKRERRHESGRMLVRAVVRGSAVLVVGPRRVRGPVLRSLGIVRPRRGRGVHLLDTRPMVDLSITHLPHHRLHEGDDGCQQQDQ